MAADGEQSLRSEHSELVRSRIRRAARQLIARQGFDITTEQVAEAAGVSTRTVFRHYPTRDQLIADGTKEMFEVLTRPILLPDPTVDMDAWLRVLALEMHTRLTDVLGRAFWDVRVPSPDNPGIVAQARAGLDSRIERVTRIVEVAWDAAGGEGAPPQWLVENFALFLSAFVTQALASDFGHTAEQCAELTSRTLKILLTQAVAEQR